MNEKILFENWKSFAEKIKGEFVTEGKYPIHGVNSILEIQKEDQVILRCKLGKTTEGTFYNWTRVYFYPEGVISENVHIKNTWLNRTFLASPSDKPILKLLSSQGASEMVLSKSQSYVQYNRVLFDVEELNAALALSKGIQEIIMSRQTP
ncbi:MAG: hypothetical protein SchgKO_10460 [Schleiferiaceae bacterium]